MHWIHVVAVIPVVQSARTTFVLSCSCTQPPLVPRGTHQVLLLSLFNQSEQSGTHTALYHGTSIYDTTGQRGTAPERVRKTVAAAAAAALLALLL